MARERKKPYIVTIPKDGDLQLNSYDTRMRAIAALERSMEKEQEWRRLVAEGKARCVKTPVLGGFRYHYELINN